MRFFLLMAEVLAMPRFWRGILLGIIAGLLIGLAVAKVMALR